MKPPEYNLLDEPWIPVRLLDGTITEVGLLELLQRSTDIADLACELPTQNIAIQRLVLAVAYRVATPLDTEAWAAQWDHGAPTEEMAEYLEKWRERFYLFGGQYPFMQVADLRTAKDEKKALDVIIASVPKEEKRLFSTRQGAGLERIDAADAARWLVHTQAYDSSGIRSGAVGDREVKGGKGYPIGPAWCGQLGLVWLKGRDLDETLVLNLIPADTAELRGGDNSSQWGACSWEMAEPETAERRDYSLLDKRGNPDPNGLSIPRLLTWHSRRVHLFGDASGVTCALVCQGDRLSPQEMRLYEPQSLWRYSKPQSTRAKQDVYMSHKFEQGRSLWRDLPDAFLSVKMTEGADKQQKREFLPSATLSFHEKFDQTYIKTEYLKYIQIQAVGVKYGTQETTFEDIYADELALSIAAIRTERKDLANVIEQQVSLTEQVAAELDFLAKNLTLAAGKKIEKLDPKKDKERRERAKERFFEIVDDPFRAWIAQVDGSCDVREIGQIWERQLYRYAIELKQEMVASVSSSAIIGRKIGEHFMNVAIAENIFNSKLRKILSNSYDKQEGTK